MHSHSPIYRSVFMYRTGMSLLYHGGYKKRFLPVVAAIQGNSVLELCFGDIEVAKACRAKGIRWSGLDVHAPFVNHAARNGYDVRLADIRRLTEFPKADTCVICGSLYQFQHELGAILQKALNSCSRVVISEPVINLSDKPGIIGKLAKRSATINEEEMPFRYTEKSLNDALTSLSTQLHFRFTVVDRYKKDIIIVLEK